MGTMEWVSLVIAITAAGISASMAVSTTLLARHSREVVLKAFAMEQESANRLAEVLISIQNTGERPARNVYVAFSGDELRDEVRRSIHEAVHDVAGDDSAWFWQHDWQEGEEEADLEIARGEVKSFGSDEEFESFLRAQPAADDPEHAENKA